MPESLQRMGGLTYSVSVRADGSFDVESFLAVEPAEVICYGRLWFKDWESLRHFFNAWIPVFDRERKVVVAR